ncbi:hypothetical protein MAM1_0017c01551 [Mucor ambiguus]|uniref:Reverse transcriptase zinc-binding domain-containing protein n=1 Tax=Mucor ambiguus TaxID=91626 RepID=A0A0C9M171_9FUNG|nr:hypothetical protein MAM1_0017c01551 [Mucor ambiguus]
MIYGSIWRPALLRYNITSWHDARSPSPVRYLGFPLYTSITQRQVFLEQLLEKVRQGCLIHQQRGLSVGGWSTVLNSLILSTLCCVGFLLSHQPASSTLYRSPPQQLDHRFSLLFPYRRPNSLRHNESSWSLLFKATDRLPKDFSNAIVSASTCLEIPLASVILPSFSSEELGRSLAQLPSSVANTMGSDPDSCLRPKHSVEFSVHPNLAKKFLNLVTLDKIKLAPFCVRAFIPPRYSSLGHFPFQQVADHTVVDVTPFIESLIHRCLPNRFSPPFSPDIPVNWFDFWLLPISHSCHNIWYRFLYLKIPHKSLLHRFIPDFFPSPSCALCSHSCDTLGHFLFLCPVKLAAWQTIQHRHLHFLSNSWTSADLHLILTTLRFPSGFPLSALLVIVATLESIWISHWSFTFSATPFTLKSVLSLAESKITKYQHEASIAAGIPHCPPPFFSVLIISCSKDI